MRGLINDYEDLCIRLLLELIAKEGKNGGLPRYLKACQDFGASCVTLSLTAHVTCLRPFKLLDVRYAFRNGSTKSALSS